MSRSSSSGIKSQPMCILHTNTFLQAGLCSAVSCLKFYTGQKDYTFWSEQNENPFRLDEIPCFQGCRGRPLTSPDCWTTASAHQQQCWKSRSAAAVDVALPNHCVQLSPALKGVITPGEQLSSSDQVTGQSQCHASQSQAENSRH